MDSAFVLFQHQMSMSRARVNHRREEPSELVYRCLDSEKFTNEYDRPDPSILPRVCDRRWNGNPMR